MEAAFQYSLLIYNLNHVYYRCTVNIGMQPKRIESNRSTYYYSSRRKDISCDQVANGSQVAGNEKPPTFDFVGGCFIIML